MKNKIFVKLAAAFGVVILLFTIILGSVFLVLFRNHTIDMNRNTMEEKAISIAETLSSFETKKGNGYGAFVRFLDELAMAEVWIVDEELQVYTCGKENQAPSYKELPENAERIVAQVFAGELTYGEEFSGLLGVKALTVGAPIYRDTEIVGAVLLHSPVSGVEDAVSQGVFALVIGCLIAILFTGVFAAGFSYRFTAPLQKMKMTAFALVNGNYEAQTGIRSEDEIGQLAGTLDTLAEHLKEAQTQRENIDRLRESFVANVSHELRTPVAVLRGYIELLRDGTISDPKEIQENYEQMLSESRHLERLVNDLLDLSRLQDAGFRLTMEEVNLCSVVSDAARAIRRTAQNRNISVKVVLPDRDCLIKGDYGRIRQMLVILLDNAVKFSYENGEVKISLKWEEHFVIRVTDHGIGIPKEQIPYIFDRFYKANTQENKNGSGLGLAIASEIAKRHQTEIHVQSDSSETTFEIIFHKSE